MKHESHFAVLHFAALVLEFHSVVIKTVNELETLNFTLNLNKNLAKFNVLLKI